MVYSGIMNFIGVLMSSGAVAFSIISLLPVELILKVSQGRGLLDGVCAAGGGDPVEPGDVVARAAGVQLAHHDRVDHRGGHREPVDAGEQRAPPAWTGTQVHEGVQGAAALAGGRLRARPALLFLLFKLVARDPRLYKAPEGTAPPPFYIRAAADRHLRRCELCARVERRAEGHGPDHADPGGHGADGVCAEPRRGREPGADVRCGFDGRWSGALDHYAEPDASVQDASQELEKFVSTKKYEPGVMLALQQMVVDIRNEATTVWLAEGVPQEMQANVRNQMYLTSETLRLMGKSGPKMSADDIKALAAYKGELDTSTKFIPNCRPGGGVMALRGHASIQGSTDIPTLFNLLPGYLPMPKVGEHDSLSDYVATIASPDQKGFWTSAEA